jgi:hypothetical protein
MPQRRIIPRPPRLYLRKVCNIPHPDGQLDQMQHGAAARSWHQATSLRRTRISVIFNIVLLYPGIAGRPTATQMQSAGRARRFIAATSPGDDDGAS